MASISRLIFFLNKVWVRQRFYSFFHTDLFYPAAASGYFFHTARSGLIDPRNKRPDGKRAIA
jgi:hypothetical protein